MSHLGLLLVFASLTVAGCRGTGAHTNVKEDGAAQTPDLAAEYADAFRTAVNEGSFVVDYRSMPQSRQRKSGKNGDQEVAEVFFKLHSNGYLYVLEQDAARLPLRQTTLDVTEGLFRANVTTEFRDDGSPRWPIRFVGSDDNNLIDLIKNATLALDHLKPMVEDAVFRRPSFKYVATMLERRLKSADVLTKAAYFGNRPVQQESAVPYTDMSKIQYVRAGNIPQAGNKPSIRYPFIELATVVDAGGSKPGMMYYQLGYNSWNETLYISYAPTPGGTDSYAAFDFREVVTPKGSPPVFQEQARAYGGSFLLALTAMRRAAASPAFRAMVQGGAVEDFLSELDASVRSIVPAKFADYGTFVGHPMSEEPVKTMTPEQRAALDKAIEAEFKTGATNADGASGDEAGSSSGVDDNAKPSSRTESRGARGR